MFITGTPITVVSGLPRSGTSLMMQMLEAAGVPLLCDDRRQADASNPRGYYELEAVKATGRDTTWVTNAPGHGVKVIHMLLHKLPRDYQYRVILMERDLGEVLASQQAMLERLEPGRGHDSRAGQERLEAIFAKQLDDVRRLLDETDCFERLSVSYSELIGQPVYRARRIIDFLNLNVTPETMAQAIDPTLYRQRN